MKNLTPKRPKAIKNISTKIVMGGTLFLLLLVLLTPEVTRRKIPFRKGDIANHDIYAPFRFAVPDHEATERLKREAMMNVLPVYNLDTEIIENNTKILDEFLNRIQKLRVEKEKIEGKRGITAEEEKQLKGGLHLKKETIEVLLGEVDIKKIQKEALRILNIISSKGIVKSRDDFAKSSRIILRKDGKEVKRDIREIFVLKDIKPFIIQEAEKSYPRNRTLREVLVDIVMAITVPNVSVDKSETLRRKEKVSHSIPMQYGWVEKDEIIVRKGEKIFDDTLAKVRVMEDMLSKERQPLRIIGIGFLIGISIMIILFYLSLLEPVILKNHSYMATIGLILIVILIIARFTIIYNVSFFLVPVAAGGMLVTILFTSGTGLITALLLSLFIGFISHFNFLFLLTGLSSSVVGIYKIRGARHRTDIIKAGFWAGVTGFLVIMAWGLVNEVPYKDTFVDAMIGLGNGFICAFLVTGCLPFFEYFLKITTDIKLLELSDLNNPLLKSLALKAPGSFQSSIVTGTLAEAAANAIGANALLARVGAYYHDIGKIKKPAYFTENQLDVKNKHEKLSSNISGRILISHVKDGVDLARQYRLPHNIINIIQEHHGTTLVFYFYQKALEERKGENIEEQNFRYPGPKPQSKEAAIVMLADSVEAASRTLTDPSPGRIENLVKKIINNKFIDYQLDECELTLKDLNKIGQSFIHHLTGILHSRVQYPDEGKVTQGSNRQSPEKKKD